MICTKGIRLLLHDAGVYLELVRSTVSDPWATGIGGLCARLLVPPRRRAEAPRACDVPPISSRTPLGSSVVLQSGPKAAAPDA